MCTGKFQFRKPGAVEQNQRTEKFGPPRPVFFRTSIWPYDQQGAQETSKRVTAEIQGGFCFEGTNRHARQSSCTASPARASTTRRTSTTSTPATPPCAPRHDVQHPHRQHHRQRHPPRSPDRPPRSTPRNRIHAVIVRRPRGRHERCSHRLRHGHLHRSSPSTHAHHYFSVDHRPNPCRRAPPSAETPPQALHATRHPHTYTAAPMGHDRWSS